MDEDFVHDVRLDLVRLLDEVAQSYACTLVVRLVRIYHIDQGSALLNLGDRVHFESVVSREVHHIELDVLIVVHELSLNRSRWEQEESLMRGHLLEHDLEDGSLAGSIIGEVC